MGRHAVAMLALAGASLAIPDIGFDVANWTFAQGISVSRGGANGTTICITGDNKSYIKALLTVPKVGFPSTFYYVVETQLNGIIPGSISSDSPKIKVYGVESGSYKADNLNMWVSGAWINSTEIIAPPLLSQDKNIQFEISIQSAGGQFCARRPRVLASQPPPSYMYPFPDPSDPSVAVAVDKTVRKQFKNSILSANSQLLGTYKYGIGYASPQTQGLLRWLQMPALRFPGGTVGNFYNWTTDSFYPKDADTCKSHTDWAHGTDFSFEFPGFAESMAETHATTVLMFNVIDDPPQSSAARLTARKSALGKTPIDWIELGNENYFIGQSCGNVNPSGSNPPKPNDYIEFTKNVAASLRGVAGGSPPLAAPLSSDDWSDGSWNAQVTNQSKLYDGYIMHPYVTSQQSVFDTSVAAFLLTASDTARGYLDGYAANVGHDVPLLITEFGVLMPADGGYLETLSKASIFTQIVDVFARGQVDVVHAGIHILLGAVGGDDSNPLFVWNPNSNVTEATPTGVIWWKLIREFAGSTLLGTDTSAPSFPGGGAAVHTQAFEAAGGDKRSLFVVNKLNIDAKVSVTLNGVAQEICEIESFSRPPLSWDHWALDAVPGLWNKTKTMGKVVSVPPLTVAFARLC